jgi:serine/threonine protein kinase
MAMASIVLVVVVPAGLSSHVRRLTAAWTLEWQQALAYMHGRNLAHLDLKPENLLLTMEKPARIKVADFGVAKGR